ncbi:hypothetical protein MA16_Dca000909 [Dendrobium catenatum]|uniref:Succinate dehydrogenase assembly factor 2, mitochondrial n=1 Tax=Dendrobium catenatum TaxID=906689 RepID=A0A2I0WVA6_9ASPA|nr:hypothetical protein MA16_Dca000909 [Dendrobium catenatum]
MVADSHKSLCLIHRHSIGSVSCFSSGSGSIEINISDEESRRRLHNRLLYRSRQRGFLELDLILGKWVEENIRSLDEAKIRSLVDVLNLAEPGQPWVRGWDDKRGLEGGPKHGNQ